MPRSTNGRHSAPGAELHIDRDIGTARVAERQDLVASHQKHPRGPEYLDRRAALHDACQPHTKIAYLKTHKTGSSTLTNIFHRIAVTYNASVVLPISNLFLGWPEKRRISESYVHVPGKMVYDIFCSAHARYDYGRISALVPGAEHITVLREPTKHFVSSWHYWNTASHIRSNSGMAVTMEQVLKDPNTWWRRAFRSDRDLLFNSQAFDLGIDHDASTADVDEAIGRMDHWALILITEYMDESLVLLKRKMCWTLDDVAYFALKVNGHAQRRPPLSSEVSEQIRRMNWMDNRLYTHFNQSLWAQINLEQNFFSEVAELRQKKSAIVQRCQQWAALDEDQHRKLLLGERGDISAIERDCHLLQLDSGGFVKYLKRVQGVPYSDAKECHRQGRPLKAYVFMPIAHAAADPIISVLHRYALREGLRPAVPMNEAEHHYNFPQDFSPQSVANIPDRLFKIRAPGTGRQYAGFDVLVSAPFKYSRKAIDQIVKGAPHVTLLRDPVARFVELWNSPDFDERRNKWFGPSATLSSILAAPEQTLQKVPPKELQRMFNAQAFALGFDAGLSAAHELESFLSRISAFFDLVLIADYMDESLVYLRRFMCWPMSTIAFPFAPPQSTLTLSRAEEDTIRRLSAVDQQLYEHFNHSFWRKIDFEISYNFEMQELRRLRDNTALACETVFASQDDHLVKLQLDIERGSPSDAIQKMRSMSVVECRASVLSGSEFVSLLAHVWSLSRIDTGHVVDKDNLSCSAGPTKQWIFLKTHKTASSTLTNIFHRYVHKNELRAVLPKDNMYLGWPTRAGALKSFTPIPGVHSYDVFCSGHAAWSRTYIRKLVPHGKQVTVLREPVSQFVSSWNHWHPYEHIVAMGGPDVTMDQFLDAPDQYWKYAKWSDEALLHNSYAYDFGITSKPSREQIADVKSALINEFDLVLITEYLDESLLLLKRIFCWTLDDILHYSLKVTHDKARHAGSKATPTQAAKIRALNYADVELYAAANASFWAKMKKYDTPEFRQELAEFRTRRDQLFKLCHRWESWEEDWHRKAILEGESVDAQIRYCHLLQLDSKGFVKLLKRVNGIQTRECRTVSVFPMKHLALEIPRDARADVISNFAYRGAFARKLLPLIPPTSAGKHPWFDKEEAFDEAFGQYSDRAASVAAESFSPYSISKDILRRYVPGYYTVAVIDDPVRMFMTAWVRLEAERRDSGKPKLDQLTFLRRPDHFIAQDPSLQELQNPLLHHYFGVRASSKAELTNKFRTMEQNFRKVLLADRMLDSMILLRREICWDREELIHYRLPLAPDGPLFPTGSEVIKLILNFSAADNAMHSHFRRKLDSTIDAELAWEEEVTELSQWLKEAKSLCGKLEEEVGDVVQQELVDAVLRDHRPIVTYPLNDRACILQKLTALSFRALIRGDMNARAMKE